MPKVPIIMPQLGESIAEATVVRLTVKVGAHVESDQEVIEVETNKAVMSVTTPCDGVIESFKAEVNETYPIGNVLGYIEASVEDAERLNAAAKPASDQSLVTEDKLNDNSSEAVNPHLHRSHECELPVDQKGAGFSSPRLRARLQELGLHPSEAGAVPASGIGGRVPTE